MIKRGSAAAYSAAMLNPASKTGISSYASPTATRLSKAVCKPVSEAAVSSTPKGECMPIRALIVDDHSVVRQGLQMFLVLDPDIEVIGEAKNGREAIQRARELRPDVAAKQALKHLPTIERPYGTNKPIP